MSRDPEALDVNVEEKPWWKHANGYFEPVLDNVVRTSISSNGQPC